MALAVTVFSIALFGLLGLFALKYWEGKRGHSMLPGARRKADALALRAKVFMFTSVAEIEKLPPHLLNAFRAGVRMIAIALAHMAQLLARRAHALADLVSHKHRFERQETHSEFLKQVIEHPMKPANGRTNLPDALAEEADGVRPSSPEAPHMPREAAPTVSQPELAPLPAVREEGGRKNGKPPRVRKKKDAPSLETNGAV